MYTPFFSGESTSATTSTVKTTASTAKTTIATSEYYHWKKSRHLNKVGGKTFWKGDTILSEDACIDGGSSGASTSKHNRQKKAKMKIYDDFVISSISDFGMPKISPDEAFFCVSILDKLSFGGSNELQMK